MRPAPSAAAERVQTLIREALGDPTLELVLRESAGRGYVDVDGDPVEPADLAAGRELTPVLRGGRRVAFLVHDPQLEEVSEVVDGRTATSFVLLENTRLVEDLRASRSRLVDTAQRERFTDGSDGRAYLLKDRLKDEG